MKHLIKIFIVSCVVFSSTACSTVDRRKQAIKKAQFKDQPAPIACQQSYDFQRAWNACLNKACKKEKSVCKNDGSINKIASLHLQACNKTEREKLGDDYDRCSLQYFREREIRKGAG